MNKIESCVYWHMRNCIQPAIEIVASNSLKDGTYSIKQVIRENLNIKRLRTSLEVNVRRGMINIIIELNEMT
jgi:hypothetical protein